MKKCKHCQSEIDSKAKVCPNCGKRQGMPVWLIVIIVIVIICIIGAVAGGGSSDEKNNSGSDSANTKKETKDTDTNDAYTLGDTFEFDGLELTFDKEYSFTTLKNEFSDLNNSDVIKLGVTVKNVSDETTSLNMFFYSIFGSKGTELDSVTTYFDDSIDFAGDLKSGASYTTYFYILYDGDGTYSIDFDNYSEKISLEFDVTK